MLAGDEPGAPCVDLAQKGTGTEVPVLNPEVVRLHGLQHRPNNERSWAWPSSRGWWCFRPWSICKTEHHRSKPRITISLLKRLLSAGSPLTARASPRRAGA